MKCVALLLLALGAAKATDYCSTSICAPGVKHIACGHDGKFASTCPPDAAIVARTNYFKNLLLNAHNSKRNFIAGGGDVNHKKACRMATMQWDDEMAKLAELNVKQCKMAHDKCRNTDTFKLSAQNVALMGWYDFDNAKLIDWGVQMWYDEVKYSNMTYIDSHPANYQGPVIGHFTIMMADRNIRVGCAASIYKDPSVPYKYYLLACNYATTHIAGFPVYNANCSKIGAGCTTGMNPAYPNLCSTSEVYDVNKWY